jgi:hypothetical protein
MTKFNDFSSAGNHAGGTLPRELGMAAISALLVCSLLAAGCSKEKSTPASSETQSSANQAVLNQPVTPTQTASAPTTVSVPSPAPKKTAKRPLMATYKDQTYGVSFRYPRIYALKSGDHLDPNSASMDFVQPGGVGAVAVELPKDLYPKTDLASAFFLVNVNKNLSTDQCGQFTLPQALASDKNGAQPSKLALGGLELQEVENISGEEMNQEDTKYYHLYQNGACYEFALGLSTEATGDDETITPVNREKVFRRLETILATVKIKPSTDSNIAVAPAATQSGQATAATSSVPPGVDTIK